MGLTLSNERWSKYAQSLPVFKNLNSFLLDLREKRAFSQKLNDLGIKCLISNTSPKTENNSPAFCIVHWNAPDFLLLNIKQLDLIYPNSKKYILDNGSKKSILKEIVTSLREIKNVTLLSVKPNADSDHTIGLQVLLNYSAQQQDEVSVFLDQDCILLHKVDDLLMKFQSEKDLLLIGARDFVVVPKRLKSLIPWNFLRCAPKMIHPSFMIMEPKRIIEIFGQTAFSPRRRAWEEARENRFGYKPYNEPYYSISHKTRNHILYLETKMSNEIPFLTSYSYDSIIYAYHAWYSSRTTNLSSQSSIDGLPLSLIQNMRKKSFDYLEQIHQSFPRGNLKNSD